MHPIVKLSIALGLLAGLGYLFMRSLHDARSEPYAMAADHVRGWSVSIEPSSNPDVALSLVPPSQLVPPLFRQVFARTMESLTEFTGTGMPLVTRSEFDRAFAGGTTVDALAATARSAGLEGVPMQPRCLGYRRVSEPRAVRQLYFAAFDTPAFAKFREQIAPLAAAGGFEPAALSPVLFVAASDGALGPWLPLRAHPDADCVAPIVLR